jgi:hypothetical protein
MRNNVYHGGEQRFLSSFLAIWAADMPSENPFFLEESRALLILCFLVFLNGSKLTEDLLSQLFWLSSKIRGIR